MNVNAATSASITHMYFAADATGTNFLAGDICEVLIYTITLSAAQIQSTEGYLSTKWGITLG